MWIPFGTPCTAVSLTDIAGETISRECSALIICPDPERVSYLLWIQTKSWKCVVWELHIYVYPHSEFRIFSKHTRACTNTNTNTDHSNTKTIRVGAFSDNHGSWADVIHTPDFGLILRWAISFVVRDPQTEGGWLNAFPSAQSEIPFTPRRISTTPPFNSSHIPYMLIPRLSTPNRPRFFTLQTISEMRYFLLFYIFKFHSNIDLKRAHFLRFPGCVHCLGVCCLCRHFDCTTYTHSLIRQQSSEACRYIPRDHV